MYRSLLYMPSGSNEPNDDNATNNDNELNYNSDDRISSHRKTPAMSR